MGKSIKFKDNSGYVYPYPYWPVGSIYISLNSTNPTNYFGGTWEQIQGRFLLGVGTPSANSDNYFGSMSGIKWNPGLGSTGGQDYHTLTETEMPEHSHRGYGYADVTDGSGSYSVMGANLASGGSYEKIRTRNTGGTKAHNNMPPYLAVYMWKRTA